MIFVCQQPSLTLFDLWSIFSYRSIYYVSHIGVTLEPLSFRIQVLTPLRDSLVVDQIYRGSRATI